jgi:hypothetical protein
MNPLSGMMAPPKKGVMGFPALPETTQPSGPAPSMFAAPQKPKNALLGASLDAFQRGFDPEGRQARVDRTKADSAERGKKMLAMMQHQRAMPYEQRMAWAQQNLPALASELGVQPVAMTPDMFTDQALDGHIAAVSSQLGIGPEKPPVAEPYTLAPGARRYGSDNKMIADNPRAEKGPEGFTLSPGQTRYGPDGKPVANVAPNAPSNGIQLEFGEGGGLSNLSIGGTGTKGKEPAIIRGPDGQPVVSPGQQQLVANKDWQRLIASEAKTELILDDITRAKGLVGPGTTGAGAVLQHLPIIGQSTDAGTMANLLKTIKSNVGFDELQQMRENSPTGGALGQVAVQEIEFLQAVLGSLEQAQKPEIFDYNLKRLEDYLKTRGEKRRRAFAQDYPSLGQFVDFGKEVTQQAQRLTATNPQTGQKVQYNEQTGQWEPAQ